ncbi:MAG: aspartate-semialdehyde dehydrogenase [Ignavibacteriales bacterium]
MAGYKVAVVGASGAVGRTVVRVLWERKFPVSELKLFATSRSAGSAVDFGGVPVEVREMNMQGIAGADFAFFCATPGVSKEFAPGLASSGTVVIDKSSYFRMDPSVPLVVPEVNPHHLSGHRGIVASPNCSTIQLVVAINPIHALSRIKRLFVSSYQSVSGTGLEAIEELISQSRASLEGGDISPGVYPRQIAFNALPHIDSFDASGYTGEELKLVNETRKILDEPGMRITATAVRVPVVYCHSEAVTIETEDRLDMEDILRGLSAAPGVSLARDAASYHTAVECAGRDEVFVSRVRKDLALENGVSMWVVADNLRKGAATNAVQIAENLAGA